MDLKTIKALEFPKILDAVAFFASGEASRAKIKDLLPMNNLAEVNSALNEVSEADKVLYQHASNISFAFDDVSTILNKADVMSVLTMGEILKVGRLLRTSRNIRNSITKIADDTITALKEHAKSIFQDKDLEDLIDKAIISESEMSDNASSELRSLRIKIKRAGDAIKTKLYHYVNSQEYSKYLQDNIVTIRGDRYVIPLKAEHRSAIPGLIHDQSASGQTIYVEPMAIVEMNNSLKMLLIEEENEIERILKEFTLKISINVPSLKISYEKVVHLDTVFAKAKYSYKHKCIMPVINDRGIINIRKGRHPLIPEDKVVPTDIFLGKDFDMLFITGPNTGGKTVALKLVGLLQVMALSGLFVPASGAELSLFSNIFSDIGDEQSIEQNLSTFSSHIANIVRILKDINSKTLILLDELGAGTDPTEGASLATAISTYIKESGAKAVITTHYNELKEYAVVTDGIENASMDFDPVSYNPTFRLVVGTPGASNAILIAKKLGLNQEILKLAEDGIKGGKLEFENVLQSLERARRGAIENEERTALALKSAEDMFKKASEEKDKLFAQREKLNENVRKETKRLVEEAMLEADEIIESMKEMLNNPTEEKLFKTRTMRKSLNKYVVIEENEFKNFHMKTDENAPLNTGDKVFIKSAKVEGEIISINAQKGVASVKLGKLTSNFKLTELAKITSGLK
ncbi:MAG: endonuclease MutS2 [Firmicutes bacterium]|nr:endonuclease MutS2 [Bacillota bacterium]